MSNDLPYRPCVGVVLANPEGLVFTGERVDTPGAWQMPQGGIDKGETPRIAALRELEEETGIPSSQVVVEAETPGWIMYDLPDHLIGKLWKGRYRGQKQKWFLLRFQGDDDAVDLDKHHREFIRWRWSTPDRVAADIVPFKRDVYLKVMTSFERQLAP
ncbi:MAG: RNA pyrophosphohydrolase [Silicimonas sp.]|nr:RNA pyrophosphohydrolase [Silicimonas sp.]RZW12784.1 MAG: RNA pyrophosphohydrolase [Paracoccaceae bacterium]